MAVINPTNPNQGRTMKKSPILGAASRTGQMERRVNKETMRPALGDNLKNLKRSITPTIRSKPYGEY